MTGGWTNAQDLNLEVGFGFGAARADGNVKDKGELAFTFLKAYDRGTFGIDIAFGGTLNPYGNDDSNYFDGDEFTIDPSENRYTSIALLYRYPIANIVYLEPRLGYSNLAFYVSTDEGRDSENTSNLTLGLGIGKTLGRFTLAFRYQYMGRTANYQNTRQFIDDDTINETVLRQSDVGFNLFIFRVTYGFDLDNLFGKKK
jgi:hypothetical protein